jgi:NADPH2:quinone reductase
MIAGGAECLVVAEVPDPVERDDEVLIQVKACGVNFPDTLIIRDLYQYKPVRPFSPGGEVAGVVIAKGRTVESFKMGDRVLALLSWGGMAEKVAVSASRIVAIPDDMPFEDAASLIMTYATSYHALKDRGGIQPDQTLLVLGAAGGVGLAAVELGKEMGARVVAAVSSDQKLKIALEHGASSGVVYARGPFDAVTKKELARCFKNACGSSGADVIFDPVGGDYTEAAFRAIAWNGCHLVVGFAAGIPSLPTNLALLKGAQIVGVFTGELAAREPKKNLNNMGAVLKLYAAGKIRPRIDASFPLEKASQAIARLADRSVIGKLVVKMQV